MATFLLILHILVAASMIVIILLQRSEGGALGMGGGGGGGLVTGRGVANLMTRMTAVLAAIFFTTSLTLGIIGKKTTPTSAIDRATEGPVTPGQPPASGGAEPLPELKIRRPGTAPQSQPQPAPAQPQLPQSQ